jgi:hypothetical protein
VLLPKKNTPTCGDVKNVTRANHLDRDVRNHRHDSGDRSDSAQAGRLEAISEQLRLREITVLASGSPDLWSEPKGNEADENSNVRQYLNAVLVRPSRLSKKCDGTVGLPDTHEKYEQKSEVSPTHDVIRRRLPVAAAGKQTKSLD